MDQKRLRRKLLSEFELTPVFDTHNHIGCDVPYGPNNCDDFSSVLITNLASGLPDASIGALPPERRIEALRSQMCRFRNLWVYRLMNETCKRLYGESEQEILNGVKANRRKGCWAAIREIMEQANVRSIVADTWDRLPDENHSWLFAAYHLDSIGLMSLQGSGDLDQAIGDETRRLRTWARKRFQVFKYGGAYRRVLSFEKIPYRTAEKVFRKPPSKRSQKESLRLEDFLFYYYLDMAKELDIPIQIHTGLGFGPLDLHNSNVLNLWSLFLDKEYWDVKFLIFHGSYPYLSEMGYTATVFRNVYLDFNFLSVLSPEVLRRALSEWIDIVPMDKLMCGSDQFFESIYAAAYVHRKVLAEVLARKIQEHIMDYDLAIEIGRRILYENAAAVIRK